MVFSLNIFAFPITLTLAVILNYRFLIPKNTTLKVTDDHCIEVDEDVFPELATTKEICFIIHTDDGRTFKNICFVL